MFVVYFCKGNFKKPYKQLDIKNIQETFYRVCESSASRLRGVDLHLLVTKTKATNK